MSKLVAMDKSVFHSPRLCDERLCVLPCALAFESVMSQRRKHSEWHKDPGVLLKRLDGAIKAGAKMGYSASKLIQAERITLCPAKSVVDESSTEQVTNGTPNTDIDFIRREAEDCRKSFEPIIGLLLNVAKTFYKNLCKNDLSKKFREEAKEQDIAGRLKKWYLEQMLLGTDWLSCRCQLVYMAMVSPCVCVGY